jgi:hypothetical protein
MVHISYWLLAAVAIGLVVTLVLASWLTPAHWWRQLNLRALAIVGAGTWAIASLVLWLAQGSMAASAGVAPLALVLPDAGRAYRVYDDLNLRAEKGTAARRIAVVPAGTVVTTTGVRDGDWWQLSARVGGKDVRGWSSSLWLRRADEL